MAVASMTSGVAWSGNLDLTFLILLESKRTEQKRLVHRRQEVVPRSANGAASIQLTSRVVHFVFLSTMSKFSIWQLRSLVDSVANLVELEQGRVSHYCRRPIQSPCVVGPKLDHYPKEAVEAPHFARCLACCDVVGDIANVVQVCVSNRVQ